MQPTRFKKNMRVWARDNQERDWLGEVQAVWKRLHNTVYLVYIYNFDKSVEIVEEDLRECDILFGDEKAEEHAAATT